ncbi:MAG: hypothetical protein V4491_05265 [Pseudomonadota bacterium]
MASHTYRPPTAYERTPIRRRLSGLGLAIGLELLLVLLLLGLGRREHQMAKNASGPTMIDIGPQDDQQDEAPPQREERKREVQKTKPKSAITPPLPNVLPAKPTIPQTSPGELLPMSREEMAASDLRNLPKAGRSAGDSEVVGKGPHGEDMYAAEWVREPSDAELQGYLPKNPRSGYGIVACKTAPGNRVEDCVELENVPPGTRLASTLRQAAWQFKVRPPRQGGKPMIGAWVRIRFDFTVSGGPGD